MLRIARIVLPLLITIAPSSATWAADLGTQLMLCTFKLVNPKTQGTVFVLTREGDRPARLLITAAHVLEQMDGDEATLVARKETADQQFERLNFALKIRREKKPLWTRHPTQDVAVLPVELPPEAHVSRVSLALLATDDMLRANEVHPGDLLRCPGFPHAAQFEPNAAGFPLIRLGCLASFPIVPTQSTKSLLFDFNTFEGDSGAPVYLEDPRRVLAGRPEPVHTQLILGVVHGQHMIDEHFRTVYQSGQTRHRMGLAIVTHASAIRETIELLDAAPR